MACRGCSGRQDVGAPYQRAWSGLSREIRHRDRTASHRAGRRGTRSLARIGTHSGTGSKLASAGPSGSQAHPSHRGLLRLCYRRTRGAEIDPDWLKRHDDLAEVLVGFHVLERLADIGEGKHLVDRQLQLALLHRSPDIPADFAENLADFLDRAGAEGDADIID